MHGDHFLIIICLLNKKSFSIISQFHVQIHRFPIDFYVNHFLPRAQDPHFPKADVERGALKAPVGLADNNDIDTSGQGGRIQPLVELLHSDKHLAGQLPDVIHGLSRSCPAAAGPAVPGSRGVRPTPVRQAAKVSLHAGAPKARPEGCSRRLLFRPPPGSASRERRGQRAVLARR